MKKNNQFTAPTIVEAKEKLIKEIPAGWFLISMKETESQKGSKKASAKTIDEAMTQAKKDIPGGSTDYKETVVREPQSTSSEVVAFDDAQARRLAVDSGAEAVEIFKVDLIKKGSSGFLGMGKKPGTYRVDLFHQAIVSIDYTIPAQVVGEISDDKHTANAKFLEYAEKGQYEQVELLLNQGVDINTCNGNGAHALILSAFYGKPKVSLLLMERGIDINHKDHGGFNALMVACEAAKADVGLVKKLLEKGADVNATSGRGGTALMSAAKIGHPDIVELLVSKGADINAKNLDHNITPLLWAANGGHRSIVEFLLKKGADRTITTFNNYTAETIAKENGHYAIVEILARKR